jgi:hypothetical protein
MNQKSDPGENNHDILEWKNHPATHNTRRTVIVSFFLIVVFIIVYFSTHSAVLTAVAVLIMLGSLASFFLPTWYSFSPGGIRIRTLSGRREYNWDRFRSFYPDRNGVLLSPFLRPSRLENFRGVYIRFSDNKEAVLDYVERMITRPDTGEEGQDVVS